MSLGLLTFCTRLKKAKFQQGPICTGFHDMKPVRSLRKNKCVGVHVCEGVKTLTAHISIGHV